MKYSVFSTKPKKNTKISYGLICVSRLESAVIMVVSPPYLAAAASMYHRKKETNHGISITINGNQAYDLMLGSFKNGFAEGTFTLPRGHVEKIDKGNLTSTKIREFVEETGLFHPQFKEHANLKLDDNFEEQWVGLDNILYRANYSLFIVDSVQEFIPVEKSKNTITKLLFPNDKETKYVYNARYDLHKKPVSVSIECLNVFINNSKYSILMNIDVNRIKHCIKKYNKLDHT